ncbi:tetratricopeptide repeat protein [Spongiimicrobium salis]|uniref:tetratricopeptide repeat protein n=1 Tax=Spongiimicrobium salis TaxID=1667022 RepID=UPI00374CAD07
MKKTIVCLIALLWLGLGTILGQEAVGEKTDARSMSKELIAEVNNRVKLFLEQEKVEEASLYIDQKQGKCNTLSDSIFCTAGLRFSQGYLFQQAAKKAKGANDYKKRAGIAYEEIVKVYPKNEVVWSNLIQLYTQKVSVAEAESNLKGLIKRLPNKEPWALVALGNVYRANKDLKKACTAYRAAYGKNPALKVAYEAMVLLYTDDNYSCGLKGSNTIRALAEACNDLNLSNRAEELLRKEFISYVQKKKFEKAEESLLLWTDGLLRNEWANSREVTQLRRKVATYLQEDEGRGKEIVQALLELERMFKSESLEGFSSTPYWSQNVPVVRIPNKEKYVFPESLFIRALLVKGKKATVKERHKEAEAFWQKAWGMASRDDLESYLEVALNLAQLYNKHPELDTGTTKFDALILELFEGKNLAYRERDLPIIRKYHIVLGSIFYTRKQWEEKATHPNSYANARFQLERAVSNRFGPIINPKLRQMLGDVYVELNQKDRAFEVYTASVEDYLAIDRIQDADKLHQKLPVSAANKNKHVLMGKIITLRSNAKDEKMMGNLSSSPSVNSYLKEIVAIEKEASGVFSTAFVNLQMFKTLADSGNNIGAKNNTNQQILHSEALSRIQNTDKLASPNDYRRIKTISTSLEKSVENREKLDKTRVYNRTDLQHVNSRWKTKTKTKTYTLGNLNKEILIPQQLFELNRVIKEDYKKSIDKKGIPNIQLKDRKFQQVIKQ